MTTSTLPSAYRVGARVRRNLRDGALGTITRVIDTEGALGGLVEVRWDGQARPSRSAGFFSPREVSVVDGPPRRLIARSFGQGVFGCSACAWTLAMPKVGAFGHRSSRARVAPVRGAFITHDCRLHPLV